MLNWVSPKTLIWKSSSLLQGHPKRGEAWGSTLWVPNLGAAPISQLGKASHVVMGRETDFWGKSQCPQCEVGHDAGGCAGPAAEFGVFGALSPASATVLSPL